MRPVSPRIASADRMNRVGRDSVSAPTVLVARPLGLAIVTTFKLGNAGNDVTAFADARLLFLSMTTDSAHTPWSVQGLLDLFDVQSAGENLFTAETGPAGEDERQVVEGTQVLAQAIVAAAKRFQGKSVRSVHAVFARAVMVGAGPVELDIDVVSEGRSTATAVVAAKQNGKRCITVTVLADVPTADVIRHALACPQVTAPTDAHDCRMPMAGRQVRLVDVVDVNSPDEVGPPELHAWLHYDPIPARDELAKALVAYFTGHLGISTTMRARESAPRSRTSRCPLRR